MSKKRIHKRPLVLKAIKECGLEEFTVKDLAPYIDVTKRAIGNTLYTMKKAGLVELVRLEKTQGVYRLLQDPTFPQEAEEGFTIEDIGEAVLSIITTQADELKNLKSRHQVLGEDFNQLHKEYRACEETLRQAQERIIELQSKPKKRRFTSLHDLQDLAKGE